MRNDLAELWDARFLLQMLVSREIKIRYKNSIFGFLWSAVPLLLDVLIYSFVVRFVFGMDARNYSAYLLCGLIPWQFVQAAVLDASQSVLAYYPIIRKVYMPREVIPLSIVVSNFIHFALNWVIYLLVFVVLLRPFDRGIPLLASMIWFPLITLVTLMLATGLALWVSALNVFFEDIKFVVQTLFRLMNFLLPVIFPADLVYYNVPAIRTHPWLFDLYMANPITAMINAYRKTLLEPIPPVSYKLKGPALPMQWNTFWIATALSVFILITGYRYFNARKWRFVERN